MQVIFRNNSYQNILFNVKISSHKLFEISIRKIDYYG